MHTHTYLGYTLLSQRIDQCCGSGFNESGSGYGPAFDVNPDPDPGFWWPKSKEKKYSRKYTLLSQRIDQCWGSGFIESGSGSSVSSESGRTQIQGFYDHKLITITAEIFSSLFCIKKCHLLIPRPPQRTPKLHEKPFLQLSKETIQHYKRFINDFLWAIFALLVNISITNLIVIHGPHWIRIQFGSGSGYVQKQAEERRKPFLAYTLHPCTDEEAGET